MKAYKGNVIYTKTFKNFTALEKGYVVVDDNGKVENCYEVLPEKFSEIEVADFGDNLIIPGFSDCHVHASQMPTIGIGYNTELIEWLDTLTIPQEIRLHDKEYAKKVYHDFANELLKYGITHSVIMTTIHADSATVLFDELIKTGLKAYVGKVCEDCNTLEKAMENTDVAIAESERFIQENIDKSELVRPIVTPTLSMICTRELMSALSKQAEKYNLPVQVHLSENLSEIDFTLKFFGDCNDFTETYEKAGIMTKTETVVAHAIHLTEREKLLIRDRNILVGHCPNSNLNLLSGVMKLAEYNDLGIRAGLGSDLAGGHTLNMFLNMVAAIQEGGMHYVNHTYSRPVTASEAFYSATKAGGSFFGKTGSFEPGYDFDALIIDDSDALTYNTFTLTQRAERMIYCSDDRNIKHVFVNGKELR
ncbi:MAG: amidohydrolase family protein [Candidatus Metalachnospira sp.]|nr:amidohydrolase family protein [Candidatus Metalachnospira sp.]